MAAVPPSSPLSKLNAHRAAKMTSGMVFFFKLVTLLFTAESIHWLYSIANNVWFQSVQLYLVTNGNSRPPPRKYEINIKHDIHIELRNQNLTFRKDFVSLKLLKLLFPFNKKHALYYLLHGIL